MNKDEIFEILKKNLIELFEIDEKLIRLDAKIYEDLDIDSIDAIDLIDSIKKKTGYRLEPNDFKNVRTLGDIVEAVASKAL
ncbi:acyl carrier protein [Campylobacter ureolyticus]|uniref:Acyl carrier protein n=1 Tax=Campylobacter ureolyticus TaxID=827 RepID=A0AAE7E8Z6_9BACT|nr:acyl carrier protein [Campylobacter ureolyticus]MCR8684088.1 acyl carrier protein [Campylobacter ureolyticus]MCZ6173422.1 acyl carrier protein [Campylobacter ureolyticus]MCZ6186069.1 acyl carrier protein [Campylobacter ureolyticus]QKF83859.1 acyl carrier protein [Campylobacter ureolyticus]QQY35985.1 acyl carrier protein [Campylobacter ureolyticus]